jgi:hypothetical protein
MRLGSKTPLVIRAAASGLGLAVLFVRVVPWTALAGLNLTYRSSVPWSVPVMSTYLVALLLYLNG